MKATVIVASMLVALAAPRGARTAVAQGSPADRGRIVYDKWCTPCHGSGEGKPGTIAAAALYKNAKPAVLAERTDLSAAGIKAAVRGGMFVMPRFRKTEVSDADLDAIIAYLVRMPAPGPKH
jgi:mono/diheme cytochrome c family protein